MADKERSVGEILEKLALDVVSLEAGDIPAMGKLMNALSSLKEASSSMDNQEFLDTLSSVKSHLESLVLGDTEDISPLEQGISKLQNLFLEMSRMDPSPDPKEDGVREEGEKAQADETPAQESKEELEKPESEPGAQPSEEEVAESSEQVTEPAPSTDISEEDKEIISDFVLEALDNLGSIEVNLVELEQNPEDVETINAIFRPFHTIKGVSGFLNLDRINKLAHSAENLLDKARNGELRIDEHIIDVILEAVDTLKRLIEGVQNGLESGGPLDIGLDTEPLKERIREILEKSEGVKDKPLGQILVEKGAVDEEKMQEVLEEQKKSPGKKVGEILIEKGAVESKEVISALRDQKKFGKKGVELHVKVDTKKLDTLVDMTGELVIAQSMLRQNEKILTVADQKLYHTLNQLHQITSTLQKTAMSMRMVPIRNTFQKMVRLVRDVARSAGKEVTLKMFGEDTEIDRNVVEELYEPMVHMIRNAVDHGIEMPEEREAAGKPRQGTVELRAYQKGSNIIIEIKDDGRGLDKERILAKAREKNLIDEEANLTENEIYNLIFRPGFSTAKKITDISGRGVGMDVVKKAIEKLRGRVEIQSRAGKGSKFIISLPLTLAIIEGMVVRVDGQRYIIPALAILESFRPTKEQYATVKGRGEMIKVRDRFMPLVRLGKLFGHNGSSKEPWEGLVVAVEHEGERMGLQLDELLGKEEVVIKSLGESLKHIKGLAGGAIMGDGRVGLILDMAGLFEIAQKN